MAWVELPPDFYSERLAVLTRQLSIKDAVAVTDFIFSRRKTFVIDAFAARAAREYVSQFRHESGGLLIGKVYETDASQDSLAHKLIVIKTSVPADEYVGTSVALKMESALWQKAEKRKKYGEFVVGWFHSHPNLGAFFSGTDRRTQASFFTMDHTIGWVIDPIRKQEAWFSGADSKEVPLADVIEGNFSTL